MKDNFVSLKQMAEAHFPGVGKQTTFKVHPRVIETGENIRPLDPEHVHAMKQSMRNGSILPPLFVRVEEGRVIMVDGHHRLAAILELISEGMEIEAVDVVQFRGNDADKTMFMITSAGGKPLTPLELGIQYKKMRDVMKWDEEKIADRAGKSKRHVTDMIDLAEANSDVHELIHAGKVAAHVALKAQKEFGKEAGKELRKKLDEAKGKGKDRVTEKTMRKPKAPSRDKVLLRAAYDMLNEIYHSEYADALHCHANYDGAQCDGECLMEDIKVHMGIE